AEQSRGAVVGLGGFVAAGGLSRRAIAGLVAFVAAVGLSRSAAVGLGALRVFAARVRVAHVELSRAGTPRALHARTARPRELPCGAALRSPAFVRARFAFLARTPPLSSGRARRAVVRNGMRLIEIERDRFVLGGVPIVPHGINSYPLLQLAGEARWDD